MLVTYLFARINVYKSFKLNNKIYSSKFSSHFSTFWNELLSNGAILFSMSVKQIEVALKYQELEVLTFRFDATKIISSLFSEIIWTSFILLVELFSIFSINISFSVVEFSLCAILSLRSFWSHKQEIILTLFHQKNSNYLYIARCKIVIKSLSEKSSVIGKYFLHNHHYHLSVFNINAWNF